MATPTYTPLATLTLSASASSVTFSSIDQSYGDLVLVIDLPASATVVAYIQPNSDSGTNYSRVGMEGSGSSTSSNSASGLTNIEGAIALSSGGGNAIIQFMDYSATDKHKSVLNRQNTISNNAVRAYAYRWADTTAITSLFIYASSSFVADSTFSLYGIAK